MIKCPRSIDKVVSDFIQLLIVEVQKEKGIDITSYIDNSLKSSTFYEEAQSNPNNSKKRALKRCQFVYNRDYTNSMTRELHKQGERCKSKVLTEGLYCYRHKKSSHARNYEKVETIASTTYKEYYPSPEVELIHLFDNIYADKSNIIVKKSSDPNPKIKWTIICWSKVDPAGNRIFCSFSQNTIEELTRQQIENTYNYEVDPSLYKQARRDYSEYQTTDGDDSLYCLF